jgi:hypothetical protein
VTGEEYANGRHYVLAEGRLAAAGYEEPFVHFAEGEGPAFLLPAVQKDLGTRPDPNPNPEEAEWLASSR